MIVVCVEGCHGSGKTALCREFEAQGFNVLDEAFLNMPRYELHPQSLTMEVMWLSIWVERLLKVQQHLKSHSSDANFKRAVFIADRSPYSAVFYAQSGGILLEGVIDQMLDELKSVGITILTAVLSVEPDILWARIQRRLAAEPERAKYNEADRRWMEKTCEFYERKERKWDFIVENNDDHHHHQNQRETARRMMPKSEKSGPATRLMDALKERLDHNAEFSVTTRI